jgi:hypothetical protein
MKARFQNQRVAHTSWEDQRTEGFDPHRPYTVALSVQSGEVVSFSLGIRERGNAEGDGSTGVDPAG